MDLLIHSSGQIYFLVVASTLGFALGQQWRSIRWLVEANSQELEERERRRAIAVWGMAGYAMLGLACASILLVGPVQLPLPELVLTTLSQALLVALDVFGLNPFDDSLRVGNHRPRPEKICRLCLARRHSACKSLTCTCQHPEIRRTR